MNGDLNFEMPSFRMPEHNLTSTGVGAAAGAVLGAGFGAVIGSTSGSAGEGFVLGSIAGAAAGGAVGYALEGQEGQLSEQREYLQRQESIIEMQQRELEDLRRQLDDRVSSGSSQAVKGNQFALKKGEVVTPDFSVNGIGKYREEEGSKETSSVGRIEPFRPDGVVRENSMSLQGKSGAGAPYAPRKLVANTNSVESANSLEREADSHVTGKFGYGARGRFQEGGVHEELPVASGRAVTSTDSRLQEANDVKNIDRQSATDSRLELPVAAKPGATTTRNITGSGKIAAADPVQGLRNVKVRETRQEAKPFIVAKKDEVSSYKDSYEHAGSRAANDSDRFVSERAMLASNHSSLAGDVAGSDVQKTSSAKEKRTEIKAKPARTFSIASSQDVASSDKATSYNKTGVEAVARKSANLDADPGCQKAREEADKASGQSSAADRLFYYRRALRFCPSEPSYHASIGDVYASIGRTEDAVFEYSQALELDPGYDQARRALSKIKPEAK